MSRPDRFSDAECQMIRQYYEESGSSSRTAEAFLTTVTTVLKCVRRAGGDPGALFKKCLACGQTFQATGSNIQKYCKDPACIDARRMADLAVDRERRATDPEYRNRERESKKRYRDAHPGEGYEKQREYLKAYRQVPEHKEKARLTSAAWRENNRERHRQQTIEWRRNNPDRAHEQGAIKEARKKNAPVVESVNRIVVAENDNWICKLCNDPIDPGAPYLLENGRPNPWYLNVDHIIPLSRGGEHSYANTQASHHICNNKKHANLL